VKRSQIAHTDTAIQNLPQSSISRERCLRQGWRKPDASPMGHGADRGPAPRAIVPPEKRPSLPIYANTGCNLPPAPRESTTPGGPPKHTTSEPIQSQPRKLSSAPAVPSPIKLPLRPSINKEEGNSDYQRQTNTACHFDYTDDKIIIEPGVTRSSTRFSNRYRAGRTSPTKNNTAPNSPTRQMVRLTASRDDNGATNNDMPRRWPAHE